MVFTKRSMDWIYTERERVMSEEKKNISVARMVGSSAHSVRGREQDDFYATDPQALINFLDKMKADGVRDLSETVWECAVGDGALAQVLLDRGHKVIGSDIVDRGFNGVYIQNFLETPDDKIFKGDILTNPPYKLAQKFIEKALNKIEDGSMVLFLLRIQFLESQGRKSFFENTPPKYVYVNSARIGIWKNNDKKSGGNGSALCFCWFVFEKGFKGDTIVRWI